jgi:hypothetical protein
MCALKSNCWLFAGPTLVGVNELAETAGVKLLAPVKRGDVERLALTRCPGVMAIADGQFHQCLSVGHAEIRFAISSGWQVWGLSSMGAIRACEMRHLGMRGYGKVYESFCRDENFRDDEVAMVHSPEPPYFPFSEPLIHIRLWLQELVKTGVINGSQKGKVIKHLTGIWFGERTLSLVRELLLNEVPKQAKELDRSRQNFDRFRAKSHDLTAFLNQKPWSR